MNEWCMLQLTIAKQSIPGTGAADSAKSDPLATKPTVDDDKSRVEDSEQNERQDEHEDVVERVEVDELVYVAVAELRALKRVDQLRAVVDRHAHQLGLHPARDVERHREHCHRCHS